MRLKPTYTFLRLSEVSLATGRGKLSLIVLLINAELLEASKQINKPKKATAKKKKKSRAFPLLENTPQLCQIPQTIEKILTICRVGVSMFSSLREHEVIVCSNTQLLKTE